MGALDGLIFGVRQIRQGLANVFLRNILSFQGGGVSVLDDPVNQQTNVVIPGASNWTTALDIDFTAQGSQTLNADGTYTIGTDVNGASMTWTKINSANDGTAMAVTNGQGLVMTPASATNIGSSSFTAPAITLPLTSITPLAAISPHQALRVWMYVASDNPAAGNDSVNFGLYVKNTGYANQFSLLNYKGWATNSGWGALLCVLNSTVLFTSPAVPITSNVGVAVYPMGFLGGYAPLMTGTYSAGWPSLSSLQLTTAGGITSAASGAISSAGSGVHKMSDVNLVLAAYRNGSGTAYVAKVGRIRVDYLQQFGG